MQQTTSQICPKRQKQKPAKQYGNGKRVSGGVTLIGATMFNVDQEGKVLSRLDGV